MTKPAPVSDEVLRELVASAESRPLGIVLLGDGRPVLVGGDSPSDVRVADLAAELLAAREALRPFAWDLRDDDLKGERGNEEHDHLIRVAWIREARRCLPEPMRPTASGG